MGAPLRSDSTLVYPVRAQSLQSCPTLCNPIDHGPPGHSVHWILQARILEWVAISFSSDNVWSEWNEVAQSCPTFCDRMDCSPPGTPVHEIFQARVLEGGAIAFSSVSSEFSLCKASSSSSTSASPDRFGGGVSWINGGSRHRPWTLIGWLQDLALSVSTYGSSDKLSSLHSVSSSIKWE